MTSVKYKVDTSKIIKCLRRVGKSQHGTQFILPELELNTSYLPVVSHTDK